MNTKLVNAAAREITAAMENGRQTPTGWAMALDAKCMLQPPETAAELTALRNDALNMRGALSPNGSPRRVPMPLGKELAPVVEWLLNRVDELEQQLAAKARASDEDPIAYVLPETAGGLTAQELALTPDGTYRCKCGHWDNVHGPFCFAAVCNCGKFTLATVGEKATPRVPGLRELVAGQRAAVEDPHDSPLHHNYLKGRDLPEVQL